MVGLVDAGEAITVGPRERSQWLEPRLLRSLALDLGRQAQRCTPSA